MLFSDCEFRFHVVAKYMGTGKVTLARSEGECLINEVGGLGIFGSYGDTTKAKIIPGLWKRVVISVKNVDPKSGKGEMKTWVGRESGVIIKDDAFATDGRFALEASNLFLFSSSKVCVVCGVHGGYGARCLVHDLWMRSFCSTHTFLHFLFSSLYGGHCCNAN